MAPRAPRRPVRSLGRVAPPNRGRHASVYALVAAAPRVRIPDRHRFRAGASRNRGPMAIWSEIPRVCRRLLRAPVFTLVTMLTLAVGIGANTAIFSIVYGVLLKPLPFAEPDRLVGVWHSAPGMGIPLLNQSPATYFTYRESGRVLEDIGMWDNGQVSITGRGEPERVRALLVTDGVLGVLKVQPLLGRLFTKADDSPGVPRRVILTYGYWQRKFG